MTVQKKRSAKPRSRNSGGASRAQNERAGIGWGLGAESADEDLFMRRMVFYAVVAVLVCMGGWFMVTTVGTGRASRNMLNATQTVPTWHTIRLWRFPNVATQRRAAQLLAGTPEMAALAGQHRFEVVEVSNDECALCVGRFRDPASPELARLLKEFADYSNGGIRPFERAEAMTIAR